MFGWIARQFGKISIGQIISNIQVDPLFYNRGEDTYLKVRVDVFGRNVFAGDWRIIDREPKGNKKQIEVVK